MILSLNVRVYVYHIYIWVRVYNIIMFECVHDSVHEHKNNVTLNEKKKRMT